MNVFVYCLVKIWINAGLFFYFARIKIRGLGNVPHDKPVLFLPNHQNALIDPLLIAVKCNRKPFFLTRSDVFKDRILKKIFNFFRMIPIYRIRDGRETLGNNQAIFDQCSDLLKNGEAVLMFPEANHNIKRRVRPLSKGFTRIVSNTLERYPYTDLFLVPVGLNYANAAKFPDRVAIYYGKAISARSLWEGSDERTSTLRIKEAVSEQLKLLTVHIESEEAYDRIAGKLNALEVDFLNPSEVNAMIPDLDHETKAREGNRKSGGLKLFTVLFECLNCIPLFFWRTFFKPKIKQPEFIATMRFAYAMLVYPIYYILLFTLFLLVFGWVCACAIVFVAFVFNVAYVRLVRP